MRLFKKKPVSSEDANLPRCEHLKTPFQILTITLDFVRPYISCEDSPLRRRHHSCPSAEGGGPSSYGKPQHRTGMKYLCTPPPRQKSKSSTDIDILWLFNYGRVYCVLTCINILQWLNYCCFVWPASSSQGRRLLQKVLVFLASQRVMPDCIRSPESTSLWEKTPSEDWTHLAPNR